MSDILDIVRVIGKKWEIRTIWLEWRESFCNLCPIIDKVCNEVSELIANGEKPYDFNFRARCNREKWIKCQIKVEKIL